MTAEQIDFVKRAYWLLADGLDDDEMISAGAAICAGIVERHTDMETAKDIHERIIMYCKATIVSFASEKEADGQKIGGTDNGI